MFRFKAIAVAAVILSATPVVPITLTGNYNTSGEARGVAVSGKYAYVADYTDGLDIIKGVPLGSSIHRNGDTSTLATLTLFSPGAANSLGANKALVVDTTVPTVSSVTSPTKSSTVSPRVIPFGGEPLAVLLMLGCGSYALKKRGRQLSNSAKNSERNS